MSASRDTSTIKRYILLNEGKTHDFGKDREGANVAAKALNTFVIEVVETRRKVGLHWKRYGPGSNWTDYEKETTLEYELYDGDEIIAIVGKRGKERKWTAYNRERDFYDIRPELPLKLTRTKFDTLEEGKASVESDVRAMWRLERDGKL